MTSVFMKAALDEAVEALVHDDVPVGAVLVKNGSIVSRNHNRKEVSKNACAHAELLVLQDAFEYEKDWRLTDYDLYSTLEPCVMCAGAIMHARIKKVVFSAWDFKWGGFGSQFNLNDSDLNHSLELVYEESVFYQDLLKRFFKDRRST